MMARFCFARARMSRQDVVYDSLLPFVGLLRCGHVSPNGKLQLLQPILRQVNCSFRPRDLALIAIAESQRNLQAGVGGVVTRIAFVSAEQVKVGHSDGALQPDIRFSGCNGVLSYGYVGACGQDDIDALRLKRRSGIERVGECHVLVRSPAHLTEQLDAAHDSFTPGSFQRQQQAVSLDLHANQVDTAHGAGVDSCLVVANDFVNSVHVVFEQSFYACVGNCGPISGRHTPGDLLIQQHSVRFRLAHVCFRKVLPPPPLSSELKKLTYVRVIFGVVWKVEVVRPRPQIFRLQVEPGVRPQSGLHNGCSSDVDLVLTLACLEAGLRLKDSVMQA